LFATATVDGTFNYVKPLAVRRGIVLMQLTPPARVWVGTCLASSTPSPAVTATFSDL
jgi:hypothetical protein